MVTVHQTTTCHQYLRDAYSPRGGGSDIFVRRLGSFFGVQNFEFQYFWGVSEKLIFLGI